MSSIKTQYYVLEFSHNSKFKFINKAEEKNTISLPSSSFLFSLTIKSKIFIPGHTRGKVMKIDRGGGRYQNWILTQKSSINSKIVYPIPTQN